VPRRHRVERRYLHKAEVREVLIGAPRGGDMPGYLTMGSLRARLEEGSSQFDIAWWRRRESVSAVSMVRGFCEAAFICSA